MMVDKRLINLCEGSKKYIGLTVLMNWVALLCNVVIILLIGRIIDNIYSGDEIQVCRCALIMLSALIIRFISNIAYGKYSFLTFANAKVTLRELIYKKLLRLGTSYSEAMSTSRIVQIAVDGVESLEHYFGKYLPQIFYSILAPITLFVVLALISVKMATVLLLCVPLIPISIIAVMKIAKKILKKYWNVYGDLGNTFLENLQGLTTLKIFNMDEERHEKMNSEAENFRKITMKLLTMQLNSITVMDIIAFGGTAAGSIIALFEFKNGLISIGSFLVIILLSAEFFIPLRLLGSFFHIAMNGVAASEKIFELLDLKENELKANPENIKIINSNQVVNLDYVTFSYDNNRDVLKDVSLIIEKNDFVALVGESGSGKSTIASIILKSGKIKDGELKIKGQNIANLTFDDIVEQIGLVDTNSYIFNETIIENLLIGKENAKKEELYEALKFVNLYDFVMDLPDKLETVVGEGGSLLSGGQRQRLALARVILADREMIIFDEATSNIDVESEEQIWQSIYNLAKTKTILVISHRLASVENADRIYVLKEGKVAEIGNNYDLYKKEGCYYKMIEKQRELEGRGATA